jgi:hypothetical protein
MRPSAAAGVKNVETFPFASGPDLNQALTVGDPGVFVATDKALADLQKDKWIAGLHPACSKSAGEGGFP